MPDPNFPVHNYAQILFAILGCIGVGHFAAARMMDRKSPPATVSRASRTALFLGLASWLVFALLRHDVVAAVGLVVAMILFWRRYRIHN